MQEGEGEKKRERNVEEKNAGKRERVIKKKKTSEGGKVYIEKHRVHGKSMEFGCWRVYQSKNPDGSEKRGSLAVGGSCQSWNRGSSRQCRLSSYIRQRVNHRTGTVVQIEEEKG